MDIEKVKRKNSKKLIALALIGYIVFVLWFCVFNRTETVYEIRMLGWSFYGMWFHWWEGYLYLQTIGNVLLYVPIGILASVFLKTKTVLFPICIGMILCSVVELLQCAKSCGTLDCDDFINNILGTLMGYLLYKSVVVKECNQTLLILVGIYIILGFRVLLVGMVK